MARRQLSLRYLGGMRLVGGRTYRLARTYSPCACKKEVSVIEASPPLSRNRCSHPQKMVNRHERADSRCARYPSGGVYRIHSEPKSGSSWFSRVLVTLLQAVCADMRTMGCRALHHEEDTRQEPELVLRFGTFYRTYLTLTPNYKHAGECMHFKNTHSAKLHVWMRWCLTPRGENHTIVPVYSDLCIPDGARRCAERLGVLSERKLLLMRDPRGVALAIAHSVIAERRSSASAGNGGLHINNRLVAPDVRSAGSEEEAEARRAEVVAWVLQSFDAIAAEMAFRYEWFTRVLVQHTKVGVRYEELTLTL